MASQLSQIRHYALQSACVYLEELEESTPPPTSHVPVGWNGLYWSHPPANHRFFFFFFRLFPSGVTTADFPSPVVSINCIFLRLFNLSHVLFHHIHKPPFWPSPFPLSWQLHPQHPSPNIPTHRLIICNELSAVCVPVTVRTRFFNASRTGCERSIWISCKCKPDSSTQLRCMHWCEGLIHLPVWSSSPIMTTTWSILLFVLSRAMMFTHARKGMWCEERRTTYGWGQWKWNYNGGRI